MNTTELVKKIKEQSQDFDWYPTTDEILECVDKHVQDTFVIYSDIKPISVLDIGAGDARAANYLSHGGTKRVIEISSVLTDAMPKDCIPVGTDFMQANIMPIKTKIIFSNPPYRASGGFAEWAKKIITEGNAQGIYLIMPERWKNNKEILMAIEERKAKAEILGEFNFLNADRKARGTVNVVFIDLCVYNSDLRKLTGRERDIRQNVDPFELWVKKTFQFDAPKDKYSSGMRSSEKTQRFTENVEKQLVTGKNQIESLVNLYNQELVDFKELYDAIAKIPYEQLKVLGASVEELKSSIQENLAGMKKKYWIELFDKYEPITSKLTKRSRKLIFEKLNDQVHVDFTLSNIYAVTAWCCKNADGYIDGQLIDVYKKLSEKANILLYKSNKRTFGDEEWRFNRRPEDLEKYCLKLDYRMVVSGYGKLKDGYYGTNGLDNFSHEFLNDFSTIAQNLGFPKTQKSESFDWKSECMQNFTWPDGQIFMQAKAHKNGNLHLKVNVEVLKSINIKFSQLMGWIKEPKEASEEMNISKEDAEKYFLVSHSILPEDGVKILQIT